MLRRDAFAGIAYQCSNILFSRVEVDRNLTLLGRVVEGIGNQVGHHLCNALPIGPDHDLLMMIVEPQPDLFLFGLFFKLIKHFRAKLIEVDVVKTHFDIAGLDLRECQQVLHQGIETVQAFGGFF